MITITKPRQIKNNNDTFLKAYLEGCIVGEADRKQIERIVSESDAAKKLRIHLNNNAFGSIKTDDKLAVLFNTLENFVLEPLSFQNTKEIAEQYLAVWYKSIEILEKVLVLVEY